MVPKQGRAAEARQLHQRGSRKVLKRFARLREMEVVELRAGEDVHAAAAEYNQSGAVEFAEPDYLLRPSALPNDPRFSSGEQWHLNNSNNADINAPEAWEIRNEAPEVIVAIIDSGVRLTHEDLAPNLWVNGGEIPGNGIDDDRDGYVDDVHGIDAIVGNGNPTDTVGHGTHVAGIIGAAGNNGLGVSGVAWKVQLMPLRFITVDAFGEATGSTSDAVECVNYAIQHGAQVINASFGSSLFSSSLQNAIASARNAGIVLVAAAGNESANNDVVPNYPGNFALDNIISVAATTSGNEFDGSYSNFGASTVDLGAPGSLIYSCGMGFDSSYLPMSGTSMAAPVVAGAMALLKAQYPTFTPAQLIQRVLLTVDPMPSLAGKCVSGGKLNLQRALSPFVNATFTSSKIAGTFPLTVQFTNTTLGEGLSYEWNFGDGSAPSTELNPSHTFTKEGSFNVTLTAITESTTSSRSQVISVLPPYVFRTVAYEWIDPTAMPRLTLADNGVTGAQQLPFSFYFFGQPRSQIYIGANGLLGFDPANMTASGNADIPTTASPNGTILPYWDNLNPAAGGAVYAGVIGQAPNRQFVVSWVAVPRNSSATDTMTFQAVLSETTGRIQYNYLEVRPASVRGGGARATVGVEDPSGLVATKYCYNGLPNRVANGQSIAFFSMGSGGLIVAANTITNFSGPAASLATNAVRYTLRNTSRVPMQWSARKTQSWITLSSNLGVLAPESQTDVIAQINAESAALSSGAHNDVISFANLNNGNGDIDQPIALEVDGSLIAKFRAPTLQNGSFHLELPGSLGQTFIIQASTNLLDWAEVDRGTVGASGFVSFNDSSTNGSRFFRAQIGE